MMELDYQTRPPPLSGLYILTWVTFLVTGILCGLGATCSGGLVLLMGLSPAEVRGAAVFILLLFIASTCVGGATAMIYLYVTFQMLRRNLHSLDLGQRTAVVNVCLICILWFLLLIYMAFQSGGVAPVAGMTVLLACMLVPHALLCWLCSRV